MSDELVMRAKNGDREAFSRLAVTSFDELFRIARLILRDDDLAADAVQDALLGAWLHIRAVREPERFGAWLRRLLVRACYRQARRAGRRRALEVGFAAFDSPARGDGPGELAVRDQVERAFQRLKTAERAVLVVHHYLDLTDGEAAVALGIPAGTFKSRLNRASASLRAALEADARVPTLIKESMR
jgi:RNA polymerase sigma-70 factor (ECF subfamily)